MITRIKITDAMLADVVKESKSFSEVLRSLGLKAVGGSITHYTKSVKALGLDTSHFSGQLWSKGKTLPKKRVADNILVLRVKGERCKTKLLVRALLELGRKHECSKCGQLPKWMGNPLTLDVDHIDENWLDDRAENLRFLCPNCHSQFSRKLIRERGETGSTQQA